MELELRRRLQQVPREQLLLIIEELVNHYPALQAEITQKLEQLPDEAGFHDASEFSVDSLVLHRPIPQQAPSADLDEYRQRLSSYQARLHHGEMPQSVFDDLVILLQEAEQRADQYDYHLALEMYAQVLDTRLTIDNRVLTHIFDRAIDEFMPVIDMLLSEVSSLITSETNNFSDHPENYKDNHETSNNDEPRHMNDLARKETSITPLLPTEQRQRWLTRLFYLWIKRIDTQQADENLPEIMLEIAWNEDIALLHELVQHEIQPPPIPPHANIVDFSQLSRTRMLEKFLREFPQS